MTGLNKNDIKLSHMMDLSIDKVKKLYDIIGLSDMAALTTALNNDDMKTIKSIFSKYSSQLVELPPAKEVQNFYHDQIIQNARNEDEAMADTADHFGIPAEEVQKMVHAPAQMEAVEEPFIADSYVKAAYDNIQEMLKGGKCKRGVFEALNAWQRRMMYGLIPNVVAKVIQGTIDMTPLALMQKQAELGGYGEPAIKEQTMSLHEMMESIIEHELNKMFEGNGDENELSGECGNCGGTGKEPETDGDNCTDCNGSGKQKENLNEYQETDKFVYDTDSKKGWRLSWAKRPENGKIKCAALNLKAKKGAPGSIINIEVDNIADAKDALIKAIDADAGSQKIEAGDSVTVDFNALLRDEFLHGDGKAILFADVLEVNGKPTLILSKTDLGGMKRATDRTAIKGRTLTSKGLQSFKISGAQALKAGLHNARYAIEAPIDYVEGTEAYPLSLISKVVHGQPEKHDDAGVTVSVNKRNKIAQESADLIKSIISKKF